MSEYKAEVFDVLKEFRDSKDPVIDWSLIWEKDEEFESILDALDTLMNNLSLLPDITDEEKIPLLGKLAFYRAHFAFLYGDEDHIKEFIEAGMGITALAHTISKIPNLMKQAEDRFSLYEEVEDSLQKSEIDDIPLEVMANLRPVFMGIAIMTIATIDQPEYQ